MSTIGIEWTERLRQKPTSASAVRRRPVSGSVAPATSGELLILRADRGGEVRRDEGLRFHGSPHILDGPRALARSELVLNNWLVDLVEMVVETLKFSRPSVSTLNSSSMFSLRLRSDHRMRWRRPQHASKETFPPTSR